MNARWLLLGLLSAGCMVGVVEDERPDAVAGGAAGGAVSGGSSGGTAGGGSASAGGAVSGGSVGGSGAGGGTASAGGETGGGAASAGGESGGGTGGGAVNAGGTANGGGRAAGGRAGGQAAGGRAGGASGGGSAGGSTAGGPPSADGGTRFAQRCAAPGVVRCLGFDSPTSIAGAYGADIGSTPGWGTPPAIDQTVFSSGGGSIRFTLDSNSGDSAGGSVWANFTPTRSVRFGENSVFYVQWRQRLSAELVNTSYLGSQGFKHVIISTGDTPSRIWNACTDLELVMQAKKDQRFPILYQSCTGSTSHGAYDPLERSVGNQVHLQYGRAAPYCLYSQLYQSPERQFPPTGNCYGYAPDEWMTWQVGVEVGPRVGDEFVNSRVRLWGARAGQPSELVMDFPGYAISAGPASEDQAFGKIWLLPYSTGKSPAQSHPPAFTWFDELIISTQLIPDP